MTLGLSPWAIYLYLLLSQYSQCSSLHICMPCPSSVLHFDKGFFPLPLDCFWKKFNFFYFPHVLKTKMVSRAPMMLRMEVLVPHRMLTNLVIFYIGMATNFLILQMMQIILPYLASAYFLHDSIDVSEFSWDILLSHQWRLIS